ncbi:hypothetical protein AQI95_41000 [Streptomyces yokosukanensis]|uniref:Uncharacterized protein n=1 Tax=Streptomyces yokosukanensis TaxID=67386 RepID=A0A101NTZ5_9ACTN|nr:hypothetical protein [Streptomyces yokosukanensis]KUM99062.1 hypothetical protein AQI95_41000 [Streptomyces yokosukanensis]
MAVPDPRVAPGPPRPDLQDLSDLPGLAGLPGLPGGGPTGRPSLGRGLALDDGDLVNDPDTGGPAEIEGLAALVQALLLAVGTQLGTDRLNTTFGFDRLSIGRYALDRQARKEYIRMELVRCLCADRRVADVREVFFQDDPRYLDFRPDLAGAAAHEQIVEAARASREYTVYAIIDTVAGSTLALTSGGRLD